MRRPVQPTLRRSPIVRKASPGAVVSPLHCRHVSSSAG